MGAVCASGITYNEFLERLIDFNKAIDATQHSLEGCWVSLRSTQPTRVLLVGVELPSSIQQIHPSFLFRLKSEVNFRKKLKIVEVG